MTAIGAGLMGFVRSAHRVRWTGTAMAIIAAALKSLDLLIEGSNVFRPMIAILLGGIAFELVLYVTDKLKESQIVNAAAGFGTGFLAATGFVFAAAYILKHKYWLGMGFAGLIKYLLVEGWQFGLLAMVTFLLGWNLVKLINMRIPLQQVLRSRFYYFISILFSVLAFILVPLL